MMSGSRGESFFSSYGELSIEVFFPFETTTKDESFDDSSFSECSS
jgi:hypothetical protein